MQLIVKNKTKHEGVGDTATAIIGIFSIGARPSVILKLNWPGAEEATGK